MASTVAESRPPLSRTTAVRGSAISVQVLTNGRVLATIPAWHAAGKPPKSNRHGGKHALYHGPQRTTRPPTPHPADPGALSLRLHRGRDSRRAARPARHPVA